MKRMIIPILIVVLFVLNGCEEPSEAVLRYEDNNEIIGKERNELVDEISDTIYESIDRSNAKAKEVVIDPVEKKGQEITLPEGRYRISGYPPIDPESNEPVHMEPQSGNVYVYDKEGKVLVHEILEHSFGVDSVTVDVNGSHKVRLDGLKQAFIVPVETSFSNELSTGIWEVGKDIEAGSYSVLDPSGTGLGYLQIFEKGETPKVYEIIDSTPDSAIHVQLKDGQKLRITGLNLLQFELE